MNNPFHDWRNPAKPCMWSHDYCNHAHVKAINQWIAAYTDGLLTTRELILRMDNEYLKGYSLGLEDAHYPVPAISYIARFNTDPNATCIGVNSNSNMHIVWLRIIELGHKRGIIRRAWKSDIKLQPY